MNQSTLSHPTGFPFLAADSPQDKLMKWEEILSDIFSAQSRIKLPQANSKWGQGLGAGTGSFAGRFTLFPCVHKCMHHWETMHDADCSGEWDFPSSGLASCRDCCHLPSAALCCHGPAVCFTDRWMREFSLGFISCHRRLKCSENSGFESEPQALVLSKPHDFSQDAWETQALFFFFSVN